MNIKCILIDDEPLAIKVIENHLSSFQNFEVVATFNNPIDAISILKEQEIDVVFLDINMSKMNGLEFVRSMEKLPILSLQPLIESTLWIVMIWMYSIIW